MLTLESLPAELLYSIHLQSLSPHLPLVSHHLHSIFHHSSTHHRALYLTALHSRSLDKSLRYPICTLPVIHAMERIVTSSSSKGKRLKCQELPRRLVRSLSRTPATPNSEGVDLPLFTYLLQEYHASPNSKKGYLLARAVYARHLPLIRLLLRHGADPALGEGFAMYAAIGLGVLGLVMLLMEREVEREGEEEEEQVVEEEEEEGENDLGEKKKRRRRSSTGGGGKRRKVGDESGDRVTATRKMLEVAIKGKHRAIQEYLQGKGATPTIESLMYL